jgi:hypothetical protein
MSVFSTRRYVELKSHVLGILYQEALQSFAAGSRAAADLVQAFEMRHISITATLIGENPIGRRASSDSACISRAIAFSLSASWLSSCAAS